MEESVNIRLIPLFCAILGALALFWQPGVVFFGDEISQSAGLYSLAHGHLWVGNLPLPYNTGLYDHYGLPNTGHIGPPVGSTPLNLIALPIYLSLRTLAGVVSFWPSLAIAEGILLGVGAAAICSMKANWKCRRAVVGCAGGLVAFGAALPHSAISMSPYMELASLELANMAITALAGVLLFALVRRRFSEKVALAATLLYVFATPAFLWSQAAKYHALSDLLVIAAFAVYENGYRTTPMRTGLAFLLGGLAAWNARGFGFLLLLTLGLLVMPAVKLGWRSCLARWAAAASIGAIGVLAIGLEYVLAGGRELEGAVQGILNPSGQAGLLSSSVFGDPVGVMATVWHVWVWPDATVHSQTLGLLVCAPFVAIGLAVVCNKQARQKLPASWRIWAALYVAVLFCVMGRVLATDSGTPEMRYASTVWFFLILFTLPIIEAAGESIPWRTWSESSVAIAGLLAAISMVTALLVHRIFLYNVTGNYYMEHTMVFRWIGLPMATAAGAAAWRFAAGRRLGNGTWIIAASVGFGLSLEIMNALSTGKFEANVPGVGELSAPFVLAPVQVLHEGVMWMYASFN